MTAVVGHDHAEPRRGEPLRHVAIAAPVLRVAMGDQHAAGRRAVIGLPDAPEEVEAAPARRAALNLAHRPDSSPPRALLPGSGGERPQHLLPQ